MYNIKRFMAVLNNVNSLISKYSSKPENSVTTEKIHEILDKSIKYFFKFNGVADESFFGRDSKRYVI